MNTLKKVNIFRTHFVQIIIIMMIIIVISIIIIGIIPLLLEKYLKAQKTAT